MIAATHGPSALWYATRGAGAVTLILLTISVVLGIGEIRRWRPARVPRFAVPAMHRTVSLLALVFLAVHILTVVLDPFPHIGPVAAVVPLSSDYRPLWLGMGALASDMLIALIVTSLLRRRMGYGVWRKLHWLAYGCWPVALMHGLGTGSDASATWMLALTAACVAAVLAAIGSRLATPGLPARVRVRVGAVVAASAIGLGLWLSVGPLASGWARRSGTPASVLAAFSPARPVAATVAAPAAAPDPLSRAFSASLSGSVHEGVGADGTSVVDLDMRLTGGPPGRLRLRLGGQPLAGGGLHMDRSAVTLGPPDQPALYSGRIEVLNNTDVRALVGSAAGNAVRLTVRLVLGNGTVSGHVVGTPVAERSA